MLESMSTNMNVNLFDFIEIGTSHEHTICDAKMATNLKLMPHEM